MRKLIIWFFSLVIIFILLMVGAYFLAKKYEEPVRNYIVGEVNKRLDAPVHVSDINFSLIERFPSASLVMDSVWAEENIIKIGDPDTLLFFEKVYLNLNILDILNGQYKINEIETRDGFIRLKVDEDGYDNYHIWKQSEDTTGFLLELDKVHIQRGDLSYRNEIRNQDIQLTADELWFTGSFSRKDYTMAVKGDGVVHTLKLKGTNYLNEREVAVESELDINTASETYAFRQGRLLIDDALDFTISGKFVGSGVDLNIAGNDLDIIKSLSLIPMESRQVLDEYQSSGIVDFKCTLKGAFGKTENPRLQADFAIVDGLISKRGSNWKLTKLVGSGSVDNGAQRNMTTTVLTLNELSGLFNKDKFQSSFQVSNFKQPSIDGKVLLKTDIKAIDEFLDIAFIEDGSGDIWLDANIHTTLLNPNEPQARDFLNSKASGSIKIAGATLKLKDDDRDYRIDSTSLRIVDNALKIESYAGAINETEVFLQGTANHFLDYFFTENGMLEVRGRVQTGEIDLQALFPTEGGKESTGSVVVAFPERASWKLDIESSKFVNGKFTATDIKGKLIMNGFKVEAQGLSFNSQSGSIQGDVGLYRFSQNQFGVKAEFDSKQIDVKELFRTFNNFDQDFMRSEHISGTADANISFQAVCDSIINIDNKSIIATAEIMIKDGGITNFEPLISVADELKKRPMLRLFVSTEELRKRLVDVQFAELENQISIRDGVVTIPQMDIRSSAINLNVSGTHTFDQEIDYAMDFALSELIELKNRTEPYNEYVQRDESGRTRIFLTMKGTTDDFEIDVKRTNVKSTLKDDMLREKNAVKGLLQDEFNVFKGDTSATTIEAPQPEVDIEFDPEAGSNAPSDKKDTLKPAEKVDKKSGIKRVFNRTETDKKKLGEGDFEDDDF